MFAEAPIPIWLLISGELLKIEVRRLYSITTEEESDHWDSILLMAYDLTSKSTECELEEQEREILVFIR